MMTEPLPETLQGFVSELGSCIESLRTILVSSEALPADTFQHLAGTFTRLLNLILKTYPDLVDSEKDAARPPHLVLAPVTRLSRVSLALPRHPPSAPSLGN